MYHLSGSIKRKKKILKSYFMKQSLLLSSVIKTGSAKEIAQWELALKAQT